MRAFAWKLGRALRQTASALSQRAAGLEGSAAKAAQPAHRQFLPLQSKWPKLGPEVFVAPNATVVGDVTLGQGASVWYGAVIRGDSAKVVVGPLTNVQDRVVIHSAPELPPQDSTPYTTFIGSEVTIGHGAVLNSCIVGDGCLVGINAVVSEGALMEEKSMLAAGSVLPKGARVPTLQLWAGNPAKYMRDLTHVEVLAMHKSANQYKQLADEHREEFMAEDGFYYDVEMSMSETRDELKDIKQ